MLASKADIGQFVQSVAGLFLIVRAVRIAILALFAGAPLPVGALFTEVAVVSAYLPAKAWIVGVRLFADHDVGTYFL